MTQPANALPELAQLLGQLADEQLSAAGQTRLLELLRDDPAARTYYLDYMDLHARLQWKQLSDEGQAAGGLGTGDWGFGIRDSGFGIPEPQAPSPKPPVPNPEPLVPPIIIDTSSPIHYPLFTIHSPLGAWLFSYAAATVVTAAMLLVFGAWRVSNERELVKSLPASTPPAESSEKPIELVGRISGTADCHWADPESAPAGREPSVPLGGKYALASGLLEITYQTGAKVILQGPCVYDVDSARGGYLSLGKLTARVERSEVSGQGAEPSPLSPLPSPLFSIRTPTAVVTDLGTEFGVEVGKEGNTTSHVFRGSVRMQWIGVHGGQNEMVLHQKESARAENRGADGGVRVVRQDAAGISPAFVRRLREPPKLLDLLDIVAGGNGTGQRRESGIDPGTGNQDRLFATYDRASNQFRPTYWHNLIDGVFIPDGRAGAVQLDSAGHTFGGFPVTNGTTYGSIWARAAAVRPRDPTRGSEYWIYDIGPARQFTPEGRGLLSFHANVGITFNLAAMRQMHPEVRPARFQAIAGVADDRPFGGDGGGAADVWVFVDGEQRFHRGRLCLQDGAVKVDVALGPRDGFLTLVSTKPDNEPGCPWVVLGDPVLRMAPAEGKEDGP